MKTLLTLTLLFSFLICLGQKKETQTTASISGTAKQMQDFINTMNIDFHAYERGRVIEHEELIRQFSLIQKSFHVQDSLYWKFINDELTANKADFTRISQHSDSTKITIEGIFLILKPKKK